jgi:hypothetical protein
MFRITRAARQHAAAIEQLRRDAYRAAPDFQLCDERSLNWGSEDTDGIVLALWHDDAIVSTTRGNLVRDRAQAEHFLECDLADIPVTYPALLLGRAATAATFARHGLHSLLRYVFIRAARDCAIACVTGIVIDGAPRTRLMHRLGYEYFAPHHTFSAMFIPNTQALVAVLSRTSFATTLSTLEREVDVSCVSESVCAEVARLLALAQTGHTQ